MTEFNDRATNLATDIQNSETKLVHHKSQGDRLRQQLIQLAMDTANHLEVVARSGLVWRQQAERLQKEFTKALDNFQGVEDEDKERRKLEDVERGSRPKMLRVEEDRLKDQGDLKRSVRLLDSKFQYFRVMMDDMSIALDQIAMRVVILVRLVLIVIVGLFVGIILFFAT